jgi:hypothetical protein
MSPPLAEWSESAFQKLSHVLARYELRLRSAEAARHLALQEEEQQLREAEIASAGLAALLRHIEQDVINEANSVLEQRGLRVARVGISAGQSRGTLHVPAPVSFQLLPEDSPGPPADPVLVFELAPGRQIRSSVQSAARLSRRRAGEAKESGVQDASAIPLSDIETEAGEFVRQAFQRLISRRPPPASPHWRPDLALPEEEP